MAYHKLLQTMRLGSPPFALVVLVGAAAWWITHTVDRITGAPTIEYSIEEDRLETCIDGIQCGEVTVQLNNLSNESFRKVTFELFFLNGVGSFEKEVKIEMQAPAWGPRQVINNSRAISVEFQLLQPGAKANITARYAGDDVTVFFLKESDDSIKLITPSIETFFVKNEHTLLGFAISILVVFTIFVVTGSILLPSAVLTIIWLGLIFFL